MKRLLTEYVVPTLMVVALFISVKAYLCMHHIVLHKSHHHELFINSLFTR
ncbi:hypothetical protein [Spirosoma arboris]|nr:hypothetical protein [Spirosoma arboris]